MPLESATYISELDPTNPVGSSDLVSSLDDHMRLVKATLQNTFPNIDGEVSATEEQINLLAATSPNDRVLRISSGAVEWGQLTTGMFSSQVVPDSALSDNVPLKDSLNTFTRDLTLNGAKLAINRASGTVCLEAVNADSGRAIHIRTIAGGDIAIVPHDGNNLRFNREIYFDSANDRWTIEGASVSIGGVLTSDLALKNVQNTFTDSQIISAASASLLLRETDAAANNQWWGFNANGEQLRGVVYNDVFAANNWFVVDRTDNTVDAIAFSATNIRLSGAVLAATIATSTSTTLVAGQVHAITSNAALPNMTAGQWVGVINNSASPITVTKHASDTMYWTASGASVTSVTVAARGKASFICADGANVYASGNITGAS